MSGALKKPEDQNDEKLIEDVAVKVTEGEDENDGMDYLYRRVTRVGRMTNCCLLVSLFALLILGIGAGVHSYKVFLLRNTYAGMCHLPLREFFNENTVVGASIKERMMELEHQHNKEARNTQFVPEVKTTFEFDFDIDVEEENYEVLELPEIFLGRYMHDFNENITVIIDTVRDRCYIMPLDRTLVPPPKNLFDMVLKMKQGYYNLNFQEIKKNYRVIGGQLPSLSGYGFLAPRACNNRRTFKLEELVGNVIVKREASNKMEKFGELVGNTLIQYHIVDIDE